MKETLYTDVFDLCQVLYWDIDNNSGSILDLMIDQAIYRAGKIDPALADRLSKDDVRVSEKIMASSEGFCDPGEFYLVLKFWIEKD